MKCSVYLADQNPHRDRTRGITELTHALLEQLALLPELEMTTIRSKSSYQFARDEHAKCLPWKTDGMLGRLVTDNFHPLFCRQEADIWLYPKGYLPAFLKPRNPCVGIVCDAILLWYFDHYRTERSRLDYFYWLNLLKKSIARLDLILTISESSKTQILELCSRFNIKPPPIEVVYAPVRYAHVKENVSKEEYVMHCASREPHKKTVWLLEQWASAVQSGRKLPLLKLVGGVPASATQWIDGRFQIEKLPFLSDSDYQQTLAKARALIMSSEIEGFGLPAAEAYCLGTPACYVKGTSVDEILAVPGQIGGFDLVPGKSLFSAVEEVLCLTPAEIAMTRARVRENYSEHRFAQRVMDGLLQIAKT